MCWDIAFKFWVDLHEPLMFKAGNNRGKLALYALCCFCSNVAIPNKKKNICASFKGEWISKS